MSFYDMTPLGHILAHFARHMFLIDEFLPEAALQVLSFSPVIFGTLALISIIVPWFWATLPIYALLIWFVVPPCISIQSKFQQLECRSCINFRTNISNSEQ